MLHETQTMRLGALGTQKKPIVLWIVDCIRRDMTVGSCYTIGLSADTMLAS